MFVCMYFLASKLNEAHPLVIHWKFKQKKIYKAFGAYMNFNITFRLRIRSYFQKIFSFKNINYSID